MKTLLIVLALVMLSACTSTGSAPPADSNAGETVAAIQHRNLPGSIAAGGRLQPGDPGYWDEEICRREPVTGTRLTRARCHSRYDWARMQGAATETMRDIFSKPVPCLEGDGQGCGD